MLGRFITLAGIIAVGAIAVGGMATRPSGEAETIEVSDHDNDNWTTQKRAGGSASVAVSSSGEVRLSRAGDSHFYADTEIDGTNVRMMVDSGASIIALTRRDAEAIGIDVDRLPVGGMASTAGGEVPMRVTVLDSVDVDGIEVRRVEAAVIDTDMGVSLLGQSFLAKLESVKVEGDTMTLR